MRQSGSGKRMMDVSSSSGSREGAEYYGPKTIDAMIAEKEEMLVEKRWKKETKRNKQEAHSEGVDEVEWVERIVSPPHITASKPSRERKQSRQQLKQQLGDANRDLWNWIALRDARVLVNRQEEPGALMDLIGLRRPGINQRGEIDYTRHERWYDLFLRVARSSVGELNDFFVEHGMNLEEFHETFIEAIASEEGKYLDGVGARRLADALDGIARRANNTFHFNTDTGVPKKQKEVKLNTSYNRDESFAIFALCKLHGLTLVNLDQNA